MENGIFSRHVSVKKYTSTCAPIFCLDPFSPTLVSLLESLVTLKKPKIADKINCCPKIQQVKLPRVHEGPELFPGKLGGVMNKQFFFRWCTFAQRNGVLQ
jgi:hypothetical protein